MTFPPFARRAMALRPLGRLDAAVSRVEGRQAQGHPEHRRRMAGRRLIPFGCAAVLIAALYAAPGEPVRAQGPDVGSDAQRESGKQLYAKYCAQCHGDKGDGEGYATPHLMPKPRNFTTGKFKIRTTPSGSLPTHQDLVSIIRRGMPYTSMPAWPDFSDEEVSNIAYFLTTFAPDFANPENTAKPVDLPNGPSASNDTIAQGKKFYEEAGCIKCHGTLGRGDGPSAPTLKDDSGHPIRPANLTQRWTFRGGSSRQDIFRTMSTGLNGTPMPSFLDALPADQRWAIIDFIGSLSPSETPNYTNLVVAKHVSEPIDVAKGAASFASAPIARFPIVGQIMEPGRAFHPSASSVTVQAIYDADSIALLVRWHDMRADKEGKNGLTLTVPPEEEEGEPAAATPAQADQPADPFAEQAAPTVGPSEFSDAVAVQIPSQPPTGARKPYFIFGDTQSSVDLWFFDLAGSAPAQFTGRGSGDIKPSDAKDLTGAANYDQGEWSVVFKRPLAPASGARFAPGEFLPIAFSVWDGLSRERGNRRGLSLWYSVYVEPENVPSAVGPMVRTALIILVIELAIVGYVRWRHSHAGQERGGQPTQPAPTRA
jgi:mono/diheme cytochrome c family protein